MGLEKINLDLKEDGSLGSVISAETAIGYLLRGGVVLGGGLIAVGWFLRVLTPINSGMFELLRRGQELPTEMVSPIRWSGYPNAWITLGLMVLIGLPMIRVALAGLVFFLQKDYLYTLFCVLVLGNLLFGFLSRLIL